MRRQRRNRAAWSTIPRHPYRRRNRSRFHAGRVRIHEGGIARTKRKGCPECAVGSFRGERPKRRTERYTASGLQPNRRAIILCASARAGATARDGRCSFRA